VSADPERSMGQTDQDQAFDWEMAALPPAEELTWYVDDTRDIDDPVWETPDPGVRAWETPDPGVPAWQTSDLLDPCDDDAPQGAPFADGGWADALAPDPVLATLVDLVQRDGLGKLDDDQLTGVLQAANRLAAWSAAAKLTAVSLLAARREQAGRDSGDWRPFDHADDEVAVALTLTRRSAGRLLDLALSLDRLPLTRAALAKGLIDERRAEVIAEELAGLDDADAAAVEKLIIGRAPKLTSGQLRALVRHAVLSADPKAARRRKEKALKDARVEMFPETSGTAALAGRDLPPAAVLAADKHLTALAQAMKAAGQPGTLDILRAWAYLHLLSGQPAATLIPAQQGAANRGGPAAGPPGGPADGGLGTAGGGLGTAGDDPGTVGGPHSEPPSRTVPHQTPSGPDAGTHFPAASDTQASGVPGPSPDGIPAPTGLRGTVNLTMPLSAWLGWNEAPGDVPGYGPVDAGDSRTLADLLTHRPGNQWCVTLTDPAGHPVAHACARHGPGESHNPASHNPASHSPGSHSPGRVGPPGAPPPRTCGPGGRASPSSPGPGRPSHEGPGERGSPGSPTGPTAPASGCGPATTPLPDWLRGLTFTTLQTGNCTHPRESRGYQPSRGLRHLIEVRNPVCTGPGCRRAAARCDLDHVTPYGQGGRTCECNLHPACRHDHHTKQVPGWTVTQDQPGTLTWTTPGHRTHTTTPVQYWD
jgi:hypothetical protein